MWGSNDKGQLGLPAVAEVAAQSSVRSLPIVMHSAAIWKRDVF